MSIRLSLIISFLLITTFSVHAETDKKGSSDHPLLSRYPGFYIDTYMVRDFDRAQMIISKMDDNNYETQTVEGQVTNIEYRIEDKSISGFQLYSNYKKALEKLDAEIIFTCFGENECGDTGKSFYNNSIKNKGLFGGVRVGFLDEFGIFSAKVNQGEQEAYVFVVTAASNSYHRRVHQTITINTSLDAEKIGIGTIENVKASIEDTGAVTLEGVYFESGTSDLTAKSNETLDTTAAYLKENSDFQFYIVGHTDWVGRYDSNVTLSKKRAQSVVAALISRGIDKARLSSVGIGPVSPVANNSGEAGRVLNRRVELVLRE